MFRYETRFSARVNDAFRPLNNSLSNPIRRQSLNQRLSYASSALDIALGPIAEKSLLDMIVFTELVFDVFRDHWIPNLYGDEGKPVLAALQQSSEDLAKVAERYLTPEQIAEVRALVDDWHRTHMNVISVEAVRLADFSAEAGAKERRLEGNISGIFGPVTAAKIEANRAISLGERGLHYATSSPTLLRMQGLVAVQDVLTELESALPETEVDVPQLRGLARDLHPLLTEVSKVLGILERNPEISARSESQLASLSNVLTQLREILTSKEGSAVVQGIPEVTDRIKAEVRGFVFELFLLGIVLILFAGFVYVLAKLAYERFSARRQVSAEASDHKKAA